MYGIPTAMKSSRRKLCQPGGDAFVNVQNNFFYLISFQPREQLKGIIKKEARKKRPVNHCSAYSHNSCLNAEKRTCTQLLMERCFTFPFESTQVVRRRKHIQNNNNHIRFRACASHCKFSACEHYRYVRRLNSTFVYQCVAYSSWLL